MMLSLELKDFFFLNLYIKQKIILLPYFEGMFRMGWGEGGGGGGGGGKIKLAIL